MKYFYSIINLPLFKLYCFLKERNYIVRLILEENDEYFLSSSQKEGDDQFFVGFWCWNHDVKNFPIQGGPSKDLSIFPKKAIFFPPPKFDIIEAFEIISKFISPEIEISQMLHFWLF